MEKLSILINELVIVNKKNFFKFIIREIIIFAISFSILFAKGSLEFKLLIVVLGCILGILGIILELKKKAVIDFCVNNYKNNKNAVIEILTKRKSRYSDTFDFVNERLLFMEILRVAKSLEEFKDEGEIGPWKIRYSKRKTEKLYKDLDLNYIKGILDYQEVINKIPLSLQDILKSFGINHRDIYDVWTKSFRKSNNEIELMYPISGILLNDSQVLRKGLRNKEYQLEGVNIKPYEIQIDDESVVMLHIKITI